MEHEYSRIDEVYRSFAPMVYRRCRALLVDEEETLDAVQDIFLRLIDALDGFRAEAQITTWIYRVATNHCLNKLRAERYRGRVLSTLETMIEIRSVENAARTFERRHFARALLDSLDERKAQMLYHHVCDGMTQSEIAEVMGVTERTVRTHLKAAFEDVRAESRAEAARTPRCKDV